MKRRAPRSSSRSCRHPQAGEVDHPHRPPRASAARLTRVSASDAHVGRTRSTRHLAGENAMPRLVRAGERQEREEIGVGENLYDKVGRKRRGRAESRQSRWRWAGLAACDGLRAVRRRSCDASTLGRRFRRDLGHVDRARRGRERSEGQSIDRAVHALCASRARNEESRSSAKRARRRRDADCSRRSSRRRSTKRADAPESVRLTACKELTNRALAWLEERVDSGTMHAHSPTHVA